MAQLPGEIKIIHKCLSILWQFILEKDRWGPRELARASGIPKSSVLRILQTLGSAGLLTHDHLDGKYVIGPDLWRMGIILNSKVEFSSVALPVVKRYMAELNENMYVFTYNKDKVVVTAEVECDHSLRLHLKIGVPYDIHRGATGKTILAHLPETDWRAIQGVLAADKDVDMVELTETLQAIRTAGYAFSDGERIDGVVGFAAPVFGPDGALWGGTAIMVPKVRYSDDVHAICVDTVRACAREISVMLGGE